MGVAMTIGTQRDAVPDAVSLFYSEDVVHIQEPRIVLRLPAASSLTAARQALRGVLRIAFDLRAGIRRCVSCLTGVSWFLSPVVQNWVLARRGAS